MTNAFLNYKKIVRWDCNWRFENKILPVLYTKKINLLGIKYSHKIRFKKNKNADTIRIAFIIFGGFGDCLIRTNYIYNLANYLDKENNPNVKFDIFAEKIYKDYLYACASPNTYIDSVRIIEEFDNNTGYDMVVHLWVNPNIWYYNSKKIEKLNPKLYNLIKQYKKYYAENVFWGPDDSAATANQIALANNKHKLQILDINSLLKIDKNFNLPVPYPKNENEILEKFGLRNKTFITLNRGISKFDPSSEGTKMWSLQNSNKLASLIKNEFPDITIVQLGVNTDWCKTLDNIDINLVGKTTIEDIKVLIKNSFLHIDCEGGFAHLRNALKAKHPAIVLFGPTDPKIYAYNTNINIYKNVCNICCEWTTLAWQKHCINTNNPCICMKSISTEEVFKTAKEYILRHVDNG